MKKLYSVLLEEYLWMIGMGLITAGLVILAKDSGLILLITGLILAIPAVVLKFGGNKK